MRYLVLCLFLTAAPAFAAGIECRDKLPDGRTLEVSIGLDVLLSNPPCDDVGIALNGKRVGGYFGHHARAFFPGGFKYRERFYAGQNGELILTGPDHNGNYDLVLKLEATEKAKPELIEAKGLKCKVNDARFYKPKLSLGTEKPLENLIADVQSSEKFESAASDALYIIKNLLEPTPASVAVYRTVLNSEKLDWSKSEVKLAYHDREKLAKYALSQMMGDASISAQDKLSMINLVISRDGVSKAEIRNIVLYAWDRLGMDLKNQGELLERMIEIPFEKSNGREWSREWLARVVFHDALKGLPVREKALNLVFDANLTSGELGTMALYLSNWADLSKHYSDMDTAVVRRIVNHPSCNEDTTDSILEALNFNASGTPNEDGFTHSRVHSSELQVRMLKELLKSEKLSAKNRRFAEALVVCRAGEDEVAAMVNANILDDEKAKKFSELLASNPRWMVNADQVLDWLGGVDHTFVEGDKLLLQIVDAVPSLFDLALYRPMNHQDDGVLIHLLRFLTTSQAERNQNVDKAVTAILASPRTTPRFIFLAASTLMFRGPKPEKTEARVRKLMEELVQHSNQSDAAILPYIYDLREEVLGKTTRKEWAISLLKKIEANPRFNEENHRLAKLSYDRKKGEEMRFAFSPPEE